MGVWRRVVYCCCCCCCLCCVLVASEPSCRACALHGEEAPRLYIIERKDGPGSTLHNVIYALGVAARNGMNFGGVVSRGEPHMNKGVNVTSMILRALSVGSGEGLFAKGDAVSRAAFSRTFSSLVKLEKKRNAFQPRDKILLTAHSMVKERGIEGLRDVRPNVTLDEYLTPQLLNALRGCRLPWIQGDDTTCKEKDTTTTTTQSPSKEKRTASSSSFFGGWFSSRKPAPPPQRPLKVVMHARRGDHAGAADKEFFKVAATIRDLAPNADVHVYSLIEGFNASLFEQRRFTIHADDIKKVEAELLFSLWTEFATADVMVVDTSSFSIAAAFFNPNCVIYHPYSLHYASDRLVLQSWVPSTDDLRVRECVKAQIHRNNNNNNNKKR